MSLYLSDKNYCEMFSALELVLALACGMHNISWLVKPRETLDRQQSDLVRMKAWVSYDTTEKCIELLGNRSLMTVLRQRTILDSMWTYLLKLQAWMEYKGTNLKPPILFLNKLIKIAEYRILWTIRRTFFFEKLPPKFRCVLYSKLI
jgi:hypothetical protein